MLEHNSGELGDQTFLERPRTDPASASEMGKPHGSAPSETLRLRSPARQEPPHADRPGPQPPSEADDEHKPRDRSEGEEVRKSWFRGHPIAVVFGLLCLVLVMAAGYLYLDYARHFQTTDDAYIAARQFAIAPEVWGYITAVPVTDNQHVDAGAVIARIDDRNYRIALAQAEAQVASAQANIETIDAQMKVQQGTDSRQPSPSRTGAGRTGVRAGAGGALPVPGANTDRGHRSERPDVHHEAG
jgi:membrane fusion protein (multidrug efflux system)